MHDSLSGHDWNGGRIFTREWIATLPRDVSTGFWAANSTSQRTAWTGDAHYRWKGTVAQDLNHCLVVSSYPTFFPLPISKRALLIYFKIFQRRKNLWKIWYLVLLNACGYFCFMCRPSRVVFLWDENILKISWNIPLHIVRVRCSSNKLKGPRGTLP